MNFPHGSNDWSVHPTKMNRAPTRQQLSDVSTDIDWRIPHQEERVDERTDGGEDAPDDPHSDSEDGHRRIVRSFNVGSDFGIRRVLGRHDGLHLHLVDDVHVFLRAVKDVRVIEELVNSGESGTTEVGIVRVNLSDVSNDLMYAQHHRSPGVCAVGLTTTVRSRDMSAILRSASSRSALVMSKSLWGLLTLIQSAQDRNLRFDLSLLADIQVVVKGQLRRSHRDAVLLIILAVDPIIVDGLRRRRDVVCPAHGDRDDGLNILAGTRISLGRAG